MSPPEAARNGYLSGAQSLDKLASLMLQVPVPSQPSLTFCDPTPAALQSWLDTLPKANLGEMARLLYQGLLELNRLQTPAANRLSLLELMRVEIHNVSKNLERYFLDRPVALDQRSSKVGSLCWTLQTHLATGYKQVLEYATPRERQPLFALALQRAIRCLYMALIRAIQLYGPPPKGLWLELHQLYLTALQEGLQHQAVRDTLAQQTGSMSIEQSYLAALLLGMARCNQLRRRNVGLLGDLLEQWSALARLQKASALGTLFVILPNVDGPPRHRSLIQSAEFPGLLGVDPHALTDALGDYLEPGQNRRPVPLPNVETLDRDLVQRLRLAWSEVAERNATRMPGNGQLRLCIGMTSVHYHLAGNRPFNDLLRHGEAPKPATFSLSGPTDIWEQPFDSRNEPDPWLGGSEQIGYTSAGVAGQPSLQANNADYPSFTVSIVNQSLSGYCLSWPDELPEQLQVGQLLGLHADTDTSWQLAVVRWIYLIAHEGHTQMGVQLLSQQAIPCGIRLIHKEKEGSQYLRAISLPKTETSQMPAVLLVPLLPFQVGNKVNVIEEGREYRALLTHRHSGTPSYNLFEYQVLEAIHPEPSPGQRASLASNSGLSPAADKDEDFDSLWKSL